MQLIYDKAISLGAHVNKDELFQGFFNQGPTIYKNSSITPELERLGETLVIKEFLIGLVSQSPNTWIDIVLDRLAFAKNISVVVSLHERKDLHPKPAPHGYLEAIERLGIAPSQTIILEDSNGGIRSAKAAGAYVIGFKANLVPGYIQEGADIYADNVGDVIKIVESKIQTSP